MKFTLNISGLLMLLISCSQKNISNTGLTTFGTREVRKNFDEKIRWHADQKLTWSNFKATPLSDDKEIAAITNCGFGFKSNRLAILNSPEITVTNIFYPQLSWVKKNQTNRDWLLEHEQLHFDISEVYARKLKRELDKAKLNYFNIQKKSEVIFKKVYAQYIKKQQEYEEQTEYSLNTAKQKEWIEKIAAELESTDR